MTGATRSLVESFDLKLYVSHYIGLLDQSCCPERSICARLAKSYNRDDKGSLLKAMLPLDTSSLYSLVAIAVLSYLLGYLAAQLLFPDRPSGDAHPFDQSHEDRA